MTDQMEHELRKLFAEDAERAPAAMGLAEEARRRVRQRRQTAVVWGVGALAAASVAAVAVVGGLGGAPAGDQVASPPVVTGKGPLPDGGSAGCAEAYSAAAVTGRAFAFDGTVTAIGPGRTDRSDADLDLVAATFTVNEWFAGGSGTAVTVDITPPDQTIEDAPPAYGVGTRLLVSGEHRWGGDSMEDAVAWTCGFTRYHNETTASRWRAAFDKPLALAVASEGFAAPQPFSDATAADGLSAPHTPAAAIGTAAWCLSSLVTVVRGRGPAWGGRQALDRLNRVG